MNVPGLPPARIVPSAHVTVPLFVKVQFGMSWLPAVVRDNVPLVFKVKIPASVPPVHPIAPLKLEVLVPLSVPLATVNWPQDPTTSRPFSVSVWPFSERMVDGPQFAFAPSVMPPADAALLKLTVTLALVMIAASLMPGTELGLQFAAVFQSPHAVFVQLMVAAWQNTADALIATAKKAQ